MRVLLRSTFIILLLAAGARAQQNSITGDCLQCHGNQSLTIIREGKQVSLGINMSRFRRSVHGSLPCETCHPGNPHEPGVPPKLRGTPEVALIRRLNRPNAPALLACGNCHISEFRTYRESIHGQAALSGNKSAPLCSDCHGSHYIRQVTDPESTVRPQHVPATCGSCHSNQRLMAKFNINTHTVDTYSQSFHGRRQALGARGVADCSSCHGYHAIFAPGDPRSSVFPVNRPRTCGRPGCHPGASTEFAAGFAHRIPSPRVDPAAYWVATIYNYIILGTAAVMLLWVLADLFRRFRRGGRHWHSPHLTDMPVPPETPIQRWDVHQRMQHMMLLISFTMLVMTGVPLLFPLSPISRLLVGLVGGPQTAGIIHRVMASILIIAGIYHLIYIGIAFATKRLGTAMIPSFKDLQDFVTMLRYYAGRSPEPLAYSRYTFDEKVEYWSMVWGTLVMIITGSVLWFPLGPAKILGVWSVDISRIIHGYEALLAAIAITIWHFYHAHLNPDVFPMNWTWLTGRITAEEQARHHPLEFKEMLEKGKLKPAGRDELES